jgi:hypothetical protein
VGHGDRSGSGALREIEAAFVIAATDGAAVLDRLGRAERLGPFTLGEAEHLSIRDVYFDTPDGALRRAGRGLRVRIQNGKTLITLKGERRANAASGVTDRSEYEAAWSESALAHVLGDLLRAGIDHAEGVLPGTEIPMDDPEAALNALDLAVIQRREAHRARRTVSEAGHAAAHLDLDTVAFGGSGWSARMRFAEIESLDGTDRIVTRAGRALMDEHPGVRPWAYGKLPTGKALGDLAGAGGLRGLLDERGDLTPAGIDAVEAALRRGPAAD